MAIIFTTKMLLMVMHQKASRMYISILDFKRYERPHSTVLRWSTSEVLLIVQGSHDCE